MILITKTLASLDDFNDGNFGSLRLEAQLKVCEIKSNLPDHVHESFKIINSKHDSSFDVIRFDTRGDREWISKSVVASSSLDGQSPAQNESDKTRSCK